MRKTEVFSEVSQIAVVNRRAAGILTAVDALDFMRALRPAVADVVFVDPPFNLGKDYGIRSTLEVSPSADYERYMIDLLCEATRVLKDGGSLFLYHVPFWASRFAAALQKNLLFRHWIAISMKNGFVRGRNLYPAHYALLYFTKGTPKRFRRPKLKPLRCRHCKGILRDYGGYANIIRKKRGVNLSDFWEDLSPVRHKSAKFRDANQLPMKLTDRVLEIAGRRGDVLVDPFIGSGTSVVSAVKRKMFYVGNDLSMESVRICIGRVSAIKRKLTKAPRITRT